jgi:hypothetical protein
MKKQEIQDNKAEYQRPKHKKNGQFQLSLNIWFSESIRESREKGGQGRTHGSASRALHLASSENNGKG